MWAVRTNSLARGSSPVVLSPFLDGPPLNALPLRYNLLFSLPERANFSTRKAYVYLFFFCVSFFLSFLSSFRLAAAETQFPARRGRGELRGSDISSGP